MTIDELITLLSRVEARVGRGAHVELESGGGVLVTNADGTEWLADIRGDGRVIWPTGVVTADSVGNPLA